MIADLIHKLQTEPTSVSFDEVIQAIETAYEYQPVTFNNGLGEEMITNTAGTNEGSCKIFAFALLHGLTQQQTLHCFGNYYREDVLTKEDGSDHPNIRLFIKYGWQGIDFNETPLLVKF
jgi:hypothetical protein